MEEFVLAWHFLPQSGRIRFRGGKVVDDGEIVRAGRTYSASDDPTNTATHLCGARRALDALYAAPGPILCRVHMWGDLRFFSQETGALHRHVEWLIDGRETLNAFADWCDEVRSALAVELPWPVDPPHFSEEDRATGMVPVRRAQDAAWHAAWCVAYAEGGPDLKGLGGAFRTAQVALSAELERRVAGRRRDLAEAVEDVRVGRVR